MKAVKCTAMLANVTSWALAKFPSSARAIQCRLVCLSRRTNPQHQSFDKANDLPRNSDCQLTSDACHSVDVSMPSFACKDHQTCFTGVLLRSLRHTSASFPRRQGLDRLALGYTSPRMHWFAEPGEMHTSASFVCKPSWETTSS